jgi:hypothetical protein
MPPQEETPATDQAEETAGRSGKMTSVLLKVGEVLKSKTGTFTITKQLQETVWFAR